MGAMIVSQFRNFKHALASSIFSFVLFHANSLFYFVSLSVAGFLILKLLPMRDAATARPGNVDLLFMSVSANTVSSLDTVEMERFSNLQLAALTLLMAAGNEIFVSLLRLYFATIRSSSWMGKGGGDDRAADHAELGMNGGRALPSAAEEDDGMRLRSAKRLSYVVLGYLVAVHVVGFLLILLYLGVMPEAAGVLKSKGLNGAMFSIFTTVSTLSNCGFVPTNENMVVFRTSSGLLLIVVAQALVGNTMYASTLRALVWALKKATGRPEYEYLLNKGDEVGYDHLVPRRHAASLALTVAGLAAVQLAIFCAMEWSSGILSGLSPYQKLVGALFMSVNSRYAGESIVDLAAVAPAILVLFVVMMYLPPYTCFLPGESNHRKKTHDKEKGKRHLGFNISSPLGYLAVFTIIACITERGRISEDPLNFSILNIVFEIVSGYAKVGYSTGYSCKRRLVAEAECREASTGFAARWSNAGKLVLVAVMLFGRTKKFCLRGGRFWLFL